MFIHSLGYGSNLGRELSVGDEPGECAGSESLQTEVVNPLLESCGPESASVVPGGFVRCFEVGVGVRCFME